MADDGMRSGPIRLVICDDHRLLTETLVKVISDDDRFEVIGPPLGSPQEAVDLVARERPHVVLMDVRFQGPMDGIEATRQIKARSPSTRVVIMTAQEDDRVQVEAMEAGASGFLRKTEGPDELLASIEAAGRGELVIDRSELARLLPRVAHERAERRRLERRLSRLTEREREILQRLAQGLGNQEIAQALFISPQTVQTHVRNILSKLAVHSKLEAVVMAVRGGSVAIAPQSR